MKKFALIPLLLSFPFFAADANAFQTVFHFGPGGGVHSISLPVPTTISGDATFSLVSRSSVGACGQYVGIEFEGIDFGIVYNCNPADDIFDNGFANDVGAPPTQLTQTYVATLSGALLAPGLLDGYLSGKMAWTPDFAQTGWFADITVTWNEVEVPEPGTIGGLAMIFLVATRLRRSSARRAR